jgi:hypothetical protein
MDPRAFALAGETGTGERGCIRHCGKFCARPGRIRAFAF